MTLDEPLNISLFSRLFIPVLYDDDNCDKLTFILQLMLKPFHIAVFSAEITAPDIEGTFSAEIIFATQFEVCLQNCLVAFEIIVHLGFIDVRNNMSQVNK